MKRLFLIPIIIVLLGGLILGGCAQLEPAPTPTPAPTPSPAPAPETLKIGALLSMTGFASASEVLIWEGVQLYEEWINEQGGITVGGQQYLLDFIVEDGQSSADGAVTAATKLVYDHGVNFMVGPVMPFMVAAQGTVTEPASVLRVVYYNAFTPEEYGPNTPFTFVCNDTTVDYMTPNMQYMKEVYPEAKTITVLTPDDGAPPYLEPIFQEKAAAEGLELLEFVLWPLDTEDFTPLTLKAVATNPDALYLINGWPIHMGAMLKAAREAGFTGPVFACHEDPYDIREVAGVDASTDFYVHNVMLDAPEMTPMIKEIAMRGEAEYGKASPTHVWGWNACYCLVQAIEDAQSLDPAAIRDNWEKATVVETAYGTGRMGGLNTYGINHTVSYPMPLSALIDGEVVWIKWQEVPLP